MPPEQVIAGLVAVVGVLWALHLKDDERERADGLEWRRLYFAVKDQHVEVVKADERDLGIKP